ncbi:hypothetical protein GJAV_G00271380 [Gymnothorax javanicus]|nr:hypothetical protein GJAV_G00271380 [Gymnothorax javanicus]
MPRHGWMLLLCLWNSVLGIISAISPAGGAVTQNSPAPWPTTDPGDEEEFTKKGQASSVWPFRATVEDKTPSFLSQPFSLPFDLWSAGTRSHENTGSPEGSRERSDVSSKRSNVAESEGDPTASSTQQESVTPPRMGLVAPLTTSDPVTSTAMLNEKIMGNRHSGWLVVNASSKDASSRMSSLQPDGLAATATAGSSYTPASGTEERGDSAKPSKGSSTPITPTVKPTSATVNWRNTVGTEPRIDAVFPESRTRDTGEKAEAGMAASDSWGDFENVAWRPAGTVASVSSKLPAGRLPESAREDGTGPGGEEPIRRWTAAISPATPPGLLFADSLADDDWAPDPTADDVSPLPDCDTDSLGLCNTSETWSPAFPDDNATSNQSYNPFLLLAPPMFVPLYSDWNSAMATWGVAWEAHVYGLGAVFALVAVASALNLLLLPFRCPSGCGYFALVNLFLLAACCSRAFSLFYDAYSHQDKLPASGTLLLYEVPFPCLTAAFGIVFLLLSMRSRMQLSNSVFQHPCFLAVLVLLHFSATLGSVVLLQVFTRLPCLFFVSQGSFVALAAFLSVAYLAFYCYVRADAKHIYHLNNNSPTADRYHRCPFADPKDWDRAAVTAVFAALFALACAGLQLYAMLHALGLGGVEVFHPWPWWAFHLSCRVCEAGVCLTLTLVVVPPLYCSGDLPQPGLCWPQLFCSRGGRVDLKSPVLPGSYQWSLTQQEKLVICDAIARRESESLPLYTLVDPRLSSLDGLDLLYPGDRLSLGTLNDDCGEASSRKSSPASPHPDSDSTADLRPPSPINLRRSIDEALFGESLFPRSLFGASRLRGSSELSLDGRGAAERQPSSLSEDPADRGLYRTSSCVEMERPPVERRSAVSSRSTLGGVAGCGSDSSVDRWEGSSGSSSLLRASLDGSSLVLCSSPEGRGHAPFSSTHPAQLQRRYRTLGSASQESLEAPAERDLAVQAEFISVCRQIDALSMCSDTIDL